MKAFCALAIALAAITLDQAEAYKMKLASINDDDFGEDIVPDEMMKMKKIKEKDADTGSTVPKSLTVTDLGSGNSRDSEPK